ncbi:MAG: hypothetical protein ACI82G_001143 [Bradymonadia bacterium]|jgi:hypothetical protein
MSTLHDARLQCHWAAQLASAPGVTLLDPLPSDHHTTLRWSSESQSLMGPSVRGLEMSLHLATLELHAGAERLALDGVTYGDAMKWVSGIFGEPVKRGDYEMPAHAVGEGGVFRLTEEMTTLATYYERGHHALSAVGGPVICWPHHFDIAVFHDLGDGKSIGTGMSPGDGSYPDPYWYATPWPYPTDTSALPALTDGRWHTDGWVGAVLPGDEEPARFFPNALACGKSVLGVPAGD